MTYDLLHTTFDLRRTAYANHKSRCDPKLSLHVLALAGVCALRGQWYSETQRPQRETKSLTLRDLGLPCGINYYIGAAWREKKMPRAETPSTPRNSQLKFKNKDLTPLPTQPTFFTSNYLFIF